MIGHVRTDWEMWLNMWHLIGCFVVDDFKAQRSGKRPVFAGSIIVRQRGAMCYTDGI